MALIGGARTQHEIGLTTSCLEAARYPDGSVRKALGEDEEEFEGIFSILGSFLGSI